MDLEELIHRRGLQATGARKEDWENSRGVDLTGNGGWWVVQREGKGGGINSINDI